MGCRVQGLKDKLPLLRQQYLGFLPFKQCYTSTEKTGVKMKRILSSKGDSGFPQTECLSRASSFEGERTK